MHHSQRRVRIWPGNLRSVNKVTSFFSDRKVAGFVSLSMPFSQHCGAIYLRSKSYLVFKISSDIMTKHCCQVCVLSMMFCRSDSRLCWPCWHGKWWRNRENLSTTWFDTPTGQRGKWYEKYSLRLIFTFYLNRHIGDGIIPCRCISIKTKILPCSVDPFQYWQHRNRLPLKLLDCAGDCGRAIQNDVDIDTYYCKRKLISWR